MIVEIIHGKQVAKLFKALRDEGLTWKEVVQKLNDSGFVSFLHWKPLKFDGLKQMTKRKSSYPRIICLNPETNPLRKFYEKTN